MLKSNPEALRAIREKAGHTCGSLSRKSKVSKQRISELEAESKGIRPTTAKQLADALEVEIEAITSDVADDDEIPAEVAS